MVRIPDYLKSNCSEETCLIWECKDVVKKNPATGRWYITMNHPGFNNRANNGNGYATDWKARAAVKGRLAAFQGRG